MNWIVEKPTEQLPVLTFIYDSEGKKKFSCVLSQVTFSLLLLRVFERILQSVLHVYWWSVLANVSEHSRTSDCSNFWGWKCFTVILMGHLRMNQITQSCQTRPPKAPNPSMNNLAEATRRKESRGQIVGQAHRLHRCARNVISRGPISVSDRRLHGWLRALSSIHLLPDKHSGVSSFHSASVFDIIYIKYRRVGNRPCSHMDV